MGLVNPSDVLIWKNDMHDLAQIEECRMNDSEDDSHVVIICDLISKLSLIKESRLEVTRLGKISEYKDKLFCREIYLLYEVCKVER